MNATVAAYWPETFVSTKEAGTRM